MTCAVYSGTGASPASRVSGSPQIVTSDGQTLTRVAHLSYVTPD